jgi:tetratricopeptide (TPR) repeat protein
MNLSFLLSILPVVSVIISFASVTISVYTFRNASDQIRLDIRKELTDLLTHIAEGWEEIQKGNAAASGLTGPTPEQQAAQGDVYGTRLSYLAQQAISIITRWPTIYVSINDLDMVTTVLMDSNLYMDEAKALCQRALQVAKNSPSRADKIFAFRLNGAYYFVIGRIEEGRSFYRQAIGVPGSAVRDAELARGVDTLCYWAMSESRSGYSGEAAARYADACDWAKEIKDSVLKAVTANSIRNVEQQLQSASATGNTASAEARPG